MANQVHVVLTYYGSDFGWGLTSPQMPELVGGHTDVGALTAEIPELIKFGGGDDTARIQVHRQEFHASPDGRDFVVRVAGTPDGQDRVQLARRLASAMKIPEQRESLLQSQAASTGEIVFVCCLPDDTIEWLVDQVDDGSPVIVVMAVDDERIVTLPVLHDPSVESSEVSLADLGLDETATVFDLVRLTSGAEPRALVMV